MVRRLLAAATVLAILLVPATAGAAQSNVGTATTSLALGSLTIDGVPAALDRIQLPSMRSFASTDSDATRNVLGNGKRFALSGVTLPVTGEIVARSDGPTSQAGRTVALAEGFGTLTVGRLDATVMGDTASSAIHALSGDLALLAGGLTAELPKTGAFSVVDAKEAESSNGAVLRDLQLGLTDILPAELLAQLPLEVLIDLVELVPSLELSEVATAVIDLLSGLELAATLEDGVDELNATIDGLQEQLDAAEAELATRLLELDDATTVVTTLEGVEAALALALADAEQAVQDKEDEIAALLVLIGDADCDALDLVPPLSDYCEDLGAATAELALLEIAADEAQEDLFGAQEDLADARAAVVTIQALIDDLQELIEDLTEQIAGLVTQLASLVADLVELLLELTDLLDSIEVADVVATVTELVEGLSALDLLAIDEVRVGVATIASASGSNATAGCLVDGVTVLGDALDVTRCDQLTALLADLQATITGLLEALPLAGSVGAVTVEGLTISASARDSRSGDYQVASAAVSALRLDVPSVQLLATLEGLLGVDIQELLDLLTGEVLLDVLELLDLEDLAGVDVEALVAELLALLEVLPASTQLTDVGTPALGLEVLDVGASSQFVAAGAGTTPVPSTGTPAVTTPPATPRPATPGTLPKTGGAGALLALTMLGLGGGSAYALRGRRARD